jgi:hypothetical protein
MNGKQKIEASQLDSREKIVPPLILWNGRCRFPLWKFERDEAVRRKESVDCRLVSSRRIIASQTKEKIAPTVINLFSLKKLFRNAVWQPRNIAVTRIAFGTGNSL